MFRAIVVYMGKPAYEISRVHSNVLTVKYSGASRYFVLKVLHRITSEIYPGRG